MNLKYAEGVEEVRNSGGTCPPPDAAAVELEAWRWVSNPLSHECFYPQAVKNPPRLHREEDLAKKCSCWGISLYTSRAQSESAFKNLERNFKRARKIFGGSVAYGKLTPADGICTPPDRFGHFDLHLSADANLLAAFSVSGEIK
ncbi:hypothetical protein [Modicisalibacter muralis]|uniref:hypothetical protein n=1 Tax=Modicisalibacter muralis TaxID=119000 RepID=UPI001113C3B0|nr:hypothetical protein [Halomonas muralis]